MRITPDLHHRSSKKSLHTFHEKISVSHFPISLHIFSKSQICVLIRFRHIWHHTVVLQVPTASRNAPNRLPVQFYPRWDLRPPFSQKIFRENPKIQKNPKNLFGHYLNPSRKKKRDLNRISLTLSNRRSLISVCSLTLSNRFLLRPSAPDMRITPDLHHLSSKKSLRTFHGKISVSHFPISLHICSK